MPIELEQFEAIAAKTPYRPKGMFYFEVFAFLQACQRHGVEMIIESGVKHGMSTKLLSSAWPGEIVSIDRDPVALEAVYPGVRLLHGDSRKLLPPLLHAACGSPERRVGVLIDGPKGSAALFLKDACLSVSSCFVVGVHDVPAGIGESLHTHHPRFAPVRDALDRFVDESWRIKYPLGSGLGIWEKP